MSSAMRCTIRDAARQYSLSTRLAPRARCPFSNLHFESSSIELLLLFFFRRFLMDCRKLCQHAFER